MKSGSKYARSHEFVTAKEAYERSTFQSFTKTWSKEIPKTHLLAKTIVYRTRSFFPPWLRGFRGTGMRLQHTRRLGSPAGFRVTSSMREKFLIVKLCPDPTGPNHRFLDDIWRNEKENRQLTADKKEIAKDLLKQHVAVRQAASAPGTTTQKTSLHQKIMDNLKEKKRRKD